MAQHDGQSDIQKLRDLIKDVRVAMLTTVDEDGSLRSRPMATQEMELDGELWFFAGAGSPKVREVQREQHVNVSYANPDDQKYVSVSGTAQVVHDRAKAEELWNPILKAWFPKGLHDPDLALLRIRVEKAEYWDTPSSKMVQLVGFVKALATGNRYEPDPDDHGNLELAGTGASGTTRNPSS
jgi:general stress protein 26